MKKLHKKCPYILLKLLTESEVIIGKSQTEALMYVKAKVCTVDVIWQARERKRKTNRKKHVLISRPPIPPPPLILPHAMAVNPRGFYFHTLDKKKKKNWKMPVNKL